MAERTEINCVCLIHGEYYSWQYVDNLYSMLCKNFSYPIKLHVFTEESRAIPSYMVKHSLTHWPEITHSRQAWWYKLQLFDPQWIDEPVLYLDLDVIITGNLDWICALNPSYFWAVRDFKRLWNPDCTQINSSVMWFTPSHASGVWETLLSTNLLTLMQKYPGDQDFISDSVTSQQIKFIDPNAIRSWRWEILNGGIDPSTKQYRQGETTIPSDVSIIVCHGNPKPHAINNSIIHNTWHGINKITKE